MSNKNLCQYYIRYRHVTPDMMFSHNSTDHIQVEAVKDATEWDLKIAICKDLEILNWFPEDIQIESSQYLN